MDGQIQAGSFPGTFRGLKGIAAHIVGDPHVSLHVAQADNSGMGSVGCGWTPDETETQWQESQRKKAAEGGLAGHCGTPWCATELVRLDAVERQLVTRSVSLPNSPPAGAKGQG